MPIRYSIASAIGRMLPRQATEKLLAHAIRRQIFRPLETVPLYQRREELWSDLCRRIQEAEEEPPIVLEFGVWEGASIREFARLLPHPDSRLFGFDSFHGLPEQWESWPKGFFGAKGTTPRTDDDRVEFVKGWFQETVPGFLAEHRAALSRHPVLVHFDADLYSSTLFLLHVIGLSLRRFYFVFDEFPGDETRALYNFLQAFGGKVEFFGRTDRALQVSGYAELPALEPAPDGAPPGMEVVGL